MFCTLGNAVYPLPSLLLYAPSSLLFPPGSLLLRDNFSSIPISSTVTMRGNIIHNLPILFSSSLLLCSGNQRRQTTFSSISVPTYRYGYYSDIYPTGAVSAKPTTTVAGPITVNGTSMAESEDQTGQYGPVGVTQAEAFIASMCHPINNTNQPDLNFPCNKIILDEAPCVYGKNYEELLKTYVNDSPATPIRSSKDQFECFCEDNGPGQSYWQNSVQYVATIIS